MGRERVRVGITITQALFPQVKWVSCSGVETQVVMVGAVRIVESYDPARDGTVQVHQRLARLPENEPTGHLSYKPQRTPVC
jgi:hypothetical protein